MKMNNDLGAMEGKKYESFSRVFSIREYENNIVDYFV